MWKMLRGLLKTGFEGGKEVDELIVGYIIAASKKCQHELLRGATCVMLTNSGNLNGYPIFQIASMYFRTVHT
jgi:hypothetical protein